MEGFNRIDTTANRLRQAMNDAGLRQTDLVRMTGIEKGSLSRYLKGEYEPKQDAIAKLAHALGVAEMWLWGYDCERHRSAVQDKIEERPVEMAERHFEMIMDEDLGELFEDFKYLDAREKRILIDLAHNMRITKTEA